MLSPKERRIVNDISGLAANAKSSVSQAGVILDKISVMMDRLRGPAGEMTDTTRVLLRQRAAGLQADLANIQELIDEIGEL